MAIMTVTLETAKKLKAAGFGQTQPYWAYLADAEKKDRLWSAYELLHDRELGRDIVAAPTTDELLAEMPSDIEIMKCEKFYDVYFYSETDCKNSERHELLCEALAAMYLWLAAEGLL